MVWIIAMTWLGVSALTLLFIMGAHAAKEPRFVADAPLPETNAETVERTAQKPFVPRDPTVDVPAQPKRAFFRLGLKDEHDRAS